MMCVIFYFFFSFCIGKEVENHYQYKATIKKTAVKSIEHKQKASLFNHPFILKECDDS